MQIIKVLHGGSMRFWGDWFGRPMDNYHKAIDAVYDENSNVLTINFDGGEECIVCSPRGITSTKNSFYIEDATSITWSWYYYGREHTKENKFNVQYIKESEATIVCIKDELNHMQSKIHISPKGFYALEIC